MPKMIRITNQITALIKTAEIPEITKVEVTIPKTAVIPMIMEIKRKKSLLTFPRLKAPQDLSSNLMLTEKVIPLLV